MDARAGAMMFAWRPLMLLQDPELYAWTPGEASPPIAWSKNGSRLLLSGLAVPVPPSAAAAASDLGGQPGAVNTTGPSPGHLGSAGHSQSRPKMCLTAVLEFTGVSCS